MEDIVLQDKFAHQVKPEESIFESFAEAVGLSSETLGLLMYMAVGLMLAIWVYTATINFFIVLIALTCYTVVASFVIGLVPYWFIPLPIVAAVIVGFFDRQDSADEVPFNWEAYGERLKRAYESIYGRNAGFEEEVDLRVGVLVETDKGFRRKLAKAWMKRVSKFVGVEWLKLENSRSKV